MRKILFGIISLSIVLNPYYVFADEISVSGNGEGSTNNVNVSVEQNTNTQQNNEAQVENNVDVNANTGENTANENTGGDVDIDTGNIDANVAISNENINQSYVETGCCNGDSSFAISGNGSDSQNVIVYANTSTSNVSITNNANISNNITGNANTGGNSANQNAGSVTIITGNIYASDNISNKDINVYQIRAKENGGSINIKIDDNGDGSDNSVVIINDNDLDITIANNANIVNSTNWDLNTGGNEANKNNGDVKIATGDIYYQSTIENGPVNFGWVDVDCCGEGGKDGNGEPPDGAPPTPPANGADGKNGNGNGNGNGAAGGNGNGQDGDGLPVTGPSNLILLGIANILMFFMGWYLRLRSGNSPNFAI